MKEIKTGFFTMDTVHAVLAMNDLVEAKNFAMSIVKQSSSARSSNIEKACSMIEKAQSIKKLALDISNFMLAHPSENLKTI